MGITWNDVFLLLGISAGAGLVPFLLLIFYKDVTMYNKPRGKK